MMISGCHFFFVNLSLLLGEMLLAHSPITLNASRFWTKNKKILKILMCHPKALFLSDYLSNSCDDHSVGGSDKIHLLLILTRTCNAIEATEMFLDL